MKTRMIVFVIGIAAAVLGCATTEVRDDQFSRAPEGHATSHPRALRIQAGTIPGRLP